VDHESAKPQDVLAKPVASTFGIAAFHAVEHIDIIGERCVPLLFTQKCEDLAADLLGRAELAEGEIEHKTARGLRDLASKLKVPGSDLFRVAGDGGLAQAHHASLQMLQWEGAFGETSKKIINWYCQVLNPIRK
jgi:hypothetical protein